MFFNKPIIISGPCSAETEAQVMKTAQQLAQLGQVDFLRAGIWKPRTKPGMFEGAGVIGLQWLQAAGKATSLKTAVEVATAKHVEEALKFEIDLLWVGARTTGNPFSVQEIADALKGVDKIVMVKNPLHPDVELWAGGLERIRNAGISKLGIIHRGFSTYAKADYRNAPMWHIALEMKRRFPQLPMLCDPSHICGRRSILQQVAQKAIDFDYDGLMVETHTDPENAWSDAKQQITPEAFAEMLRTLIWKQADANTPAYIQALADLREQINTLDDELINVLGQRMKLVEHIAAFKKDNNVTLLQTSRWNEVLERITQHGTDLGLSPDFIRRYFEAVHLESLNHQSKVIEE